LNAVDEYAEGYEPEITFRKYAAGRRGRSDQEVEDILNFLADLVGSGPVMELGIGVGRIALPLAARGLRVDGVEISSPVVDRLRQVPGGDRLSVTIGNFADVAYPDTYSLIYVVANALLNLYSQEAQIQCFKNVSTHLSESGLFVVESFGPGFIMGLDNKVRAVSIDADAVRLEAHRHDGATQIVEWNYVTLDGGGTRFLPIVQRYIWPSEMDLMAQVAGLRLRERWGGWHREPLRAESLVQVAVYGR
jgi:hypothetical protein